MRTRWLWPAALAALVLGSCSVRENVFARVGDRDIELERLQSYLESMAGIPWQEAEEEVASQVMDQFLDEEVILAAAGATAGPELPGSAVKRSAEVRRLITSVCGPTPEVAAAILEEEVVVRLQQSLPTRARVRQMVLDDEQSALDVRRRLMDGEDFVELSREVSRAPNSATGGALGMLEKGVLTEELDGVIFSLAEGEFSDPVEGPAGLHIFQVLEIVPAGSPPRSEVEAAVASELGDRARRDFVRDCMHRQASEVGVQVLPDHLWFRYSGRYSEE